MRRKSYACGGCHRPDNVGDTKLPTILPPDVHCSDCVPMATIATFPADKVSACGTAFFAVSTRRAGPAGVAFFLQYDLHPHSLRFVAQQMAGVTMRPLMQALVIGGADIQVLANIAHITNHHGLHALLIQRGNQMRGLLVLDIIHLELYLLELFLL